MDLIALSLRADRLPHTIAGRTRRVYDRMAFVYPASTFLFHSKAHRYALEVSGIRDGMRVLEVATGSGEMFRRLVAVNRNGSTVGLDLSPNMAARTQHHARSKFPASNAHCQAVDARHIPFRDESFDAVVCCYLLELLAADDILLTLREIRRVLRRGSNFTLVCIGEDVRLFNRLYHLCGNLAPAFWGRQVAGCVPEMIEAVGLRLIHQRTLRQGLYPSRVLVARKDVE
jgi:ubiquinone/menaquinone biosynthesis C-methylase UbiE